MKIQQSDLTTGTGFEGVQRCRDSPCIDLIIKYIMMPDMNGYEAARKIREFNKGLPIIAQTACGLSGDREKAIEAVCNDYLSKPILKDRLMELINTYFEHTD